MSNYHLVGSYKTHEEAIVSGHYDLLHGLARSPSLIVGAAIHPVDCKIELTCPAQVLLTMQAHERYRANMADLAELEIFGIKNHSLQLEFPICVIWTAGGELYLAILGYHRENRYLSITEAHPNGPLGLNMHYLLHMNAKT